MTKKPLAMTSLEKFLYDVDKSFPVPLSEKQNLKDYAKKLFSCATICAEVQNGEILSMVAGYTENLTDNIAYIAVVATIKAAQGRGLASKCVREFIEICKEKSINAVHLYTDTSNKPAKAMYQKIGFVNYNPKNEHRPQDAHFIYTIRKD